MNTEENSNNDLNNIDASLTRIAASLEAIAEFQYISLIPMILLELPTIFENAVQIRAYLLSDGSKSSRDIAKQTSVSHQTIANWWDRWSKEFAIVEQDSAKASFRRLYSLTDLISIYGSFEAKENQDE